MALCAAGYDAKGMRVPLCPFRGNFFGENAQFPATKGMR